MNALKRFLGIIWILLSPATVAFLLWQASDKIGKASDLTSSNVTFQWVIIFVICIPIVIDLLIFVNYVFGFKVFN